MFTKLREEENIVVDIDLIDIGYCTGIGTLGSRSQERGHFLTAEFKVTFGICTEDSELWSNTPNTLVSDNIWELKSECRKTQGNTHRIALNDESRGPATLEAPPPSKKKF